MPQIEQMPASKAGASAGWSFMFSNPAHILALGFGSGLSPIAPGTAGTLIGWLVFSLLESRLAEAQWGAVILFGALAGIAVCAITARNLHKPDPGSVVWDEIVAIWLVLWFIAPAGFMAQLLAFVLFRFFDAVKPGPVAWADELFHAVDLQNDPWAWTKAGIGIMLDDLVAAACTLLVIALWSAV